MKTVIEVTQEDIGGGTRGDTFSCPIAIAARRINGSGQPMVSGGTIAFWGLSGFDSIGRGDLPLKARRFIRRFDKGKNVKPITFEVDLV